MIKKIFIILLINSSVLFGQNSTDEFLINIRNGKYELAKNNAYKLDLKNDNCNEKNELLFFIELAKNKGVRHKNAAKIKNYTPSNCSKNLFIQTISKLNLGLYNYYFKKNSDIPVLSIYLEALKSIEKTNLNILKGEIIRRILEYHNDIFILKDYSYKQYIILYKELAFDKTDIYISDFYDLSIGTKNTDSSLSKTNYNLTLKLINNLNITHYKNKLLIIAGNYLEEFVDKKPALELYEKSLSVIENDTIGVNILSKLASKLNIGVYYYYSKEYKRAINEFNYINLFSGKLVDRKQVYYDYWLSLTYEEIKDYKKAYLHLKASRRNQFSFNQSNHLKAIRDIQEKYQTEKKDEKIALQKSQQRNIILGSILFIVFGGTIGFLTLKNSRRKQLLAEQQKELETQKNLTLLKEQELTTINAMIDGQEKERTRIAEDLHDNLGSVLATLKLHFENLKFNKNKKILDQESLFNKTENLIDEAYLKVRSIAHAKNAGVIANQGLLSSMQMMAEKISSADNISIEVVHFGLEKRLENSLEIAVFRIIQELITNIIKHANATNTTVNLSLYNNTLTIIVEDNGIGFDIEQIDLTNSMGLHSIQTRITHLKGTLDIDSTVSKGTSIILNIPIA